MTASSEEANWPPTQPFSTPSGTLAPAAARAERKESSYTFLRKVTYSTSKITGVIMEEKNIPLSLKYSFVLRFISVQSPVIALSPFHARAARYCSGVSASVLPVTARNTSSIFPLVIS